MVVLAFRFLGITFVLRLFGIAGFARCLGGAVSAPADWFGFGCIAGCVVFDGFVDLSFCG